MMVCLASDNERNRAQYLMEEVNSRDEFDEAFFSCDLGVTKSDPRFFEMVAKKLEVEPEQIEYWDDDPKNVEVARKVGIDGNVYTDFEDFRDKVIS